MLLADMDFFAFASFGCELLDEESSAANRFLFVFDLMGFSLLVNNFFFALLPGFFRGLRRFFTLPLSAFFFGLGCFLRLLRFIVSLFTDSL